MGQTIICEYLAKWESTGTPPDPAAFGFDGLYSMLVACQDAMLELGSAANDGKRTVDALRSQLNAESLIAHEANKRVAELVTQRDRAFQAIESTKAQYEAEARQMFGIIEARDRRIAELEAAN